MSRIKISEEFMNNGDVVAEEPQIPAGIPIAEDSIDDEVIDTPAEEEVPAPAEELNEEAAPEVVVPEEGVPAAVPAPAAFTADFKYMADGKEKEIPEYLRNVIKDKATEDTVKTLLAKADGLEAVSARREEFRIARDEARKEVSMYKDSFGNLKKSFDRGDDDGFFQQLEVPDEFVIKYALKRAQILQGDQAARAHHEQETRQRQQQWAREDQLNHTNTRMQELEVKDLQNQFNLEMMKPEVSQFKTVFDKSVGKAGAFEEAIKDRGELAYHRTNKIVSPGELIQGLMTSNKGLANVPQQAPQQAAPAPGAAAKPGPVKVNKVATIPSVGGSQSTPVSEGFTSLEQLREYKNSLRKGTAR